MLTTAERLFEAGLVLARERTLDGVLRRVAELATQLAGAKYGALGILDETNSYIGQFVTVGIDDETRAKIGPLPTGKGILGVLIDDPRPLRLKNLHDDPRSVGFPKHHPPMTSFLGVPIKAERSVAGRIYLTEKIGGDEFTAEDERIVTLLARQAAIAIDSADLYEATERAARELGAANERLREADQHKSAFLANMSHELRSPLNTILGYARLLIEEGEEFTDEHREDLAIIEQSGSHLLELIAELLDLSRIDAGRLELHLSEVDGAAMVRDVASAIRPSVHPGVELVVQTSDAILDLTCDRSRLRQMLLNVAGNAAKFTTEGSLCVRADAEYGYVVFTVVDTGPGISEADQERVFESFYQSVGAQVRTPRQNEGAGLGLAITRRLAEAHGGSVTLSSAVGRGTTVTVRMPVIPTVNAASDVAGSTS